MQHFLQTTIPSHSSSVVPVADGQRLDSTWREMVASCQVTEAQPAVTGTTFVPIVKASEHEQLTRGYQTTITPWVENYSVQDVGASGAQFYATNCLVQDTVHDHMSYEYYNQKYHHESYHDGTTAKLSLQEFDVFHHGDILALEAPIDSKRVGKLHSDQDQSIPSEQESGHEPFIAMNNDSSEEQYIVTSLDDSSASVLPSFRCFEQRSQGQYTDIEQESNRNGTDLGLVTRFNYCSFFIPNEIMGTKNSYTAI